MGTDSREGAIEQEMPLGLQLAALGVFVLLGPLMLPHAFDRWGGLNRMVVLTSVVGALVWALSIHWVITNV